TRMVHPDRGIRPSSDRENGPSLTLHLPRLRRTTRDSTSERSARASNSGACTGPLNPWTALRTRSGFRCQNCDKNCVAVSPPSSCILIAAIIVCWCREPGEEDLARATEASLSTGDVPPDALHAGQAAPLFSLPDADMENVDL